jgi:hypothetical protein
MPKWPIEATIPGRSIDSRVVEVRVVSVFTPNVDRGIRFAGFRERSMRSESDRVRVHEARSIATPSLHLPLRRLALCLDCEACFEIGAPACFACGGDTWAPLAKFLDQGPLRVFPQLRPLPRSWKESPKPVAKQMLVIARDEQRLYEYARRAFAGNPTVEVVLDRRRAERRRADGTRMPDRRRGDRRLTLEVDEHLRTRGWAVVRVDVFRSLGRSTLSDPR